MPKWKYKLVSRSPSGQWTEDGRSSHTLDDLGAEGWEAVGYSNERNGAEKILFKRPI